MPLGAVTTVVELGGGGGGASGRRCRGGVVPPVGTAASLRPTYIGAVYGAACEALALHWNGTGRITRPRFGAYADRDQETQQTAVACQCQCQWGLQRHCSLMKAARLSLHFEEYR